MMIGRDAGLLLAMILSTCLAGAQRPNYSLTPEPQAVPEHQNTLEAVPAPMPEEPIPEVWLCVTPGQSCTAMIVQALSQATQSILVQAYSFTSAPIAKALVEAHTRGVQVQVILDKSQRTEKYSSADFLANQGIPVSIDAAHAIAHNKIMIIDGTTVLTGSFNFTKAAEEKNAENLLILAVPALADQYRLNWERHRAHSHPYKGRGAR